MRRWVIRLHYNLVVLLLITRSIMKRSLSDGNILRENNTPVRRQNAGQEKLPNSATSNRGHQEEDALDHSDSTPEISACESDVSFQILTMILVNSSVLVLW